MAKPEWGTKRTCASCGARFYDLQKDPITCPACGTVVTDVTASSKPRRVRATPKLAQATAGVALVKATADAADVEEVEVEEAETEGDEIEVTEGDEDEVAVADDGDEDADEDGESAIEDVSELGDDDVSDVIETDLEDDSEER